MKSAGKPAVLRILGSTAAAICSNSYTSGRFAAAAVPHRSIPLPYNPHFHYD